MFWAALRHLLIDNAEALERLDNIRDEFSQTMNNEMENMWAKKLGLIRYDPSLVNEMLQLMVYSQVDYTIFFRRLSNIPDKITYIKESFYQTSSEQIDNKWISWLQRWREKVKNRVDQTEISAKMKLVNPKYTWREWLITPAYEKAEQGDYSLIKELQTVLANPYEKQSLEIERKYDRLKPKKFFNSGGISHYSCSS